MARPKNQLPDAAEIMALFDETGALQAKVTPSARQNSITLPDQAGENISVRVTAPPENGKANAAVIALLARALGCPKSQLELVRGETSRIKTFRLLDL